MVISGTVAYYYQCVVTVCVLYLSFCNFCCAPTRDFLQLQPLNYDRRVHASTVAAFEGISYQKLFG